MNLHIKPISAENKKEALQLNVKTEQSSFIEPVSQCIQEAEQLDLWNPVAIYHGTDMIGFAMYGFFPYEDTHGRVWLDRFLIDNRYQGKGYGKAALKLLITRLFIPRLVFKKMVKKTSTGKLLCVYRRITSLSDNSTKYPDKVNVILIKIVFTSYMQIAIL